MMIETWLLIDKTALNIMWDQSHPTDDTPVPDDVRVLMQAVRGFWKDSGTNEVVNVIDNGLLDQFMIDHATDISARYDWVQGPGLDALNTGYQTVPAEVLALMKDHIVYDENGDIVSTTPSSFDNPNWGHVFFGQSTRIFAGDFSTDDFNGDFL